MATATKGRQVKKRAGWTTEQVEQLKKAVAVTRRAGKPMGLAFEQIAEQRGVKASAIQAKYYSLQPKRRRKASATNLASSSARNTMSARPVGRPVGRPPKSTTLVTSMTNRELASLLRTATAELEGRMVNLEANVLKLLG